uniref:TubG1 n=1 Tax=Arundo donax TaxID=35708 RepID=A0A0A9G709_ARUDO
MFLFLKKKNPCLQTQPEAITLPEMKAQHHRTRDRGLGQTPHKLQIHYKLLRSSVRKAQHGRQYLNLLAS